MQAHELVIIEPQIQAGAVWTPVLGQQSARFLERQTELTRDEMTRLATEAHSVLGACQPPGTPGVRTVLAVGRIQSGKTLSFETVTALARDNGFAAVIILAGISKFLESQTRRRIIKDFALETDPEGWESWALASSGPLLGNSDQGLPLQVQAWEQWLAGPREADPPPTIVLVALKQYQHINAIADVIPRSTGIPALVIDDESDQSSLNGRVRRAGRPATTTYRSITNLRSRLSSHTYVQYTATPQANLLLAAADVLAPDAVRLITPGEDYVGSEAFFDGDGGHLVKDIPDDDAGVFEHDLHITEPPASLMEAIDYFIVSSAFERATARAEEAVAFPSPVSMLVHPARLVSEHSKAARWIRARLHALVSMDNEALAEALEPALGQLKREQEVEGPSIEELVADVRRTLQGHEVIMLNRSDEGYEGAPGEDLPWMNRYAWIVVGGQMVDRGLTLPGLTVTYMPRSPGRTADTVQQRARWLGYKRRYLDRCRLWLTTASQDFFSDYTEHERFMHEEIERIVAEGETLKQWRRRFLLDPRLKLTRDNVISRTMHQRQLSEWEVLESLGPGDPPTAEIAAAYGGVIAAARGLPGEPREEHGHRFIDCSLTNALAIIEEYPVLDPADAEDTKALLLAYVARQIDARGGEDRDDRDNARVYLMGDLKVRERSVRERDGTYALSRLLQGRNNQYPGDRAMRKESGVPPLTLQLHRIRPTSGTTRGGPPFWGGGATMIALAVHVPPGTDPGWIIEEA